MYARRWILAALLLAPMVAMADAGSLRAYVPNKEVVEGRQFWLVIEASDWFADFRPTLRLGGGLKSYSFTTNGASSSASFTGDIGVGFRGGTGPIEISGEMRLLPSAFDQAKLPLRGLSPQDQRQTDVLFSIGVTVKP